MKTVNKCLKLSVVPAFVLGLSLPAYATDEAFDATMTLVAPIVITESQGLSFADTIAGANTSVVTAATDGTAAIFTATGEANAAVTGSVVEASITMTTGGGATTAEQIVVDTFTTAGDMDASGAATFDGAGDLSDLRIGGTAHVEAEDVAGSYTGQATFRLVYN